MKKFLSIALALAMVFCLAACGGQGGKDPTPNPDPTPSYVSLRLNLKNKTDKIITGLYIYESGSEDKGLNLCNGFWAYKGAENEGDANPYEVNAFIYRDAKIEKYDLYATFEDETDATWTGLTIANYDKLSMKGVTAEDLTHEAVDDDEDKKAMDAVAAKGYTTDGFYPGHTLIELELKNKTSKKGNATTIKELYIYPKDAADKGANLLKNVYPEGMEEGAEYVFGSVIREAADVYCIEAVFDGVDPVIYEANEFSKADGDGHVANEVSFQSETDPDVWKVQYDDGEACLRLLHNASANGVTFVCEEDSQEKPALDGFVPKILQ